MSEHCCNNKHNHSCCNNHRSNKNSLIKIIITAVLLVLMMIISHIFIINKYILFLLYLIPYLFIGFDILKEAGEKLLKGKALDEDFLMSAATIGAIILGEYPEAIAVMLFYYIGELFESYATEKSKKSVSSLMNIRPDYANLEENNSIKKVSPEEVKIGDIIVVKPGEKIPLDGVVYNGSSSVDTSSLTGESYPVDVFEGDDVLNGCINLNGILKIKVTKEYQNSTVSKILKLTEEAQEKASKSEKFISKFAKIYTPFVVSAAVLLAVIPSIFTGNVWEWIYRALIFLVVSCPCALVVSIPLCFFIGIGKASKHGILIKGGEYIENLSACDTFIFDKTGTLTKGIFNITAIHPQDISEDELLKLAAHAEFFSNHPIADTIKEKYSYPIDQSIISDINEIPGKGISIKIENKDVLVGNTKLMEDNGIKWHPCHHIGTTVHIAVNNIYAGHIVISDTLKDGSKEAITQLNDLGIKNVFMLTGDNEEISKEIAGKLNIKNYYSSLLPADKLDIANKIMKESKKTAFIGDGINDAPVLAGADIGISMGSIGSDAAIEASDVILMDDNLLKLPKAVQISKITVKKVYINIIFILLIKFSVLILGALGIVGMWAAVFADVGSLILAVINSAVDKLYVK